MSRERPAITMIGNAHLDPAWMWEWGEGMEAFIATCRSALARMRETPDFIFTCSSAAHYAWIEETEPEMFREIVERVGEGRWEVVGGWWTQADCNIPSGEGLLRQGELAQAWFREKFGRTASVGYSPDAFGHSAGLPQILRLARLDSYIFCRPDPTELELPAPLFNWRSLDGASVLGYRVPFHYNMYQTTVRKKVEDLRVAFENRSELAGTPLREITESWALFYGVGNHGGGPTKEQIATIEEIGREAEVAIAFGRISDYLEGVDRTAVPEMSADLQMNSPGTYSVHAAIKRLNRRAEEELCRAEILDAMATLQEREGTDAYPARYRSRPTELLQAWRNVCFNHFHDILCGVAIKDALEDAVFRYGESLRIAETTAQHAVRAIARRIDTSEEIHTLIVVNPNAFAIDEPIDFELWHDIDKERWGREIDLRVIDDAGNDVVVDRIETRGKIGDDRVAGRFRGEIPPFGWRSWRVRYGEKGDPTPPTSAPVEASATLLRNEHLELHFAEIDTPAGITRLLCRAAGVDLLSGRAGYFAMMEDNTDTWGHGVDRFNTPSIPHLQAISSDITHHGDTGATLRTRSAAEGITVEQWYTLHRDADWVDVRCRITNTIPGTLKLCFESAIEGPETTVASLYSSTMHAADGAERPGGSWKMLHGTIDGRSVALGIADTQTHGYSAESSTLALTVLRATRYATHEPHPHDDLEENELIDIGTTEFRYRIRPVVDADPLPILARDAQILLRRPIATLESPHTPIGEPLPRTYSGIELSNRAVLVTVLRREEGSGYTLRLFNSSREEERTTLRLPAAGVDREYRLSPHQVVMVEIP